MHEISEKFARFLKMFKQTIVNANEIFSPDLSFVHTQALYNSMPVKVPNTSILIVCNFFSMVTGSKSGSQLSFVIFAFLEI